MHYYAITIHEVIPHIVLHDCNLIEQVGFMRNGILVGEDSPGTLISKQNASTLEEAFLSLCCMQESGEVSINNGYRYDCYLKKKKKV